MIEKYFYIYSFNKICDLFPQLKSSHFINNNVIHGGWVSSMKEYTGKAYKIQHNLGNTYELYDCPYYFDNRLGTVLDVDTDMYHPNHPVLIKSKTDPYAYCISPRREKDMLGSIINIDMNLHTNNERALLGRLLKKAK